MRSVADGIENAALQNLGAGAGLIDTGAGNDSLSAQVTATALGGATVAEAIAIRNAFEDPLDAGSGGGGGGGAASTLPDPLAFYVFDEADGTFEDVFGGPAAEAYTLDGNAAVLRTDGVVTGPDGATQDALDFNGLDEFGFIPNDPRFQVENGTISITIRPDDLSRESYFLSKDERNTGDGGHFFLGHTDEGGLILRFAPSDGGSNKTWETPPLLTEGVFTQITLSFVDGLSLFSWTGRKFRTTFGTTSTAMYRPPASTMKHR